MVGSYQQYDPQCLGAHTHLPVDYAYQEAERHTTTPHCTVSQLARLTPNLRASDILIALLLAITKKFRKFHEC